jgi:hypothetical protein
MFSSNFGHYLYINVRLKILMMIMMMMKTMMMMMMMMTTTTTMMVMVRNSAHLLCFLIYIRSSILQSRLRLCNH